MFDLYRERDHASASTSLASGEQRRAIALWGPSQSGKSTMLSAFVDEKNGPDFALTWSSAQPFRFQYSNRFPEIAGFNPYNFGSDASGCVTRFTGRESVQDPLRPIQIRLMSRMQIMQALGAGYVWECNLLNAEGKIVKLDGEIIGKWLAAIPSGNDTPLREAAEILIDLVRAMDALIEERPERYENLFARDVWRRELRKQILSHAGLSASPEEARKFAYVLLWDGRPRMREIFEALEEFRRELAEWFGDRPIFCNARFASYLVDIETLNRIAKEGHGEEDAQMRLKRELMREARVRWMIASTTSRPGKR